MQPMRRSGIWCSYRNPSLQHSDLRITEPILRWHLKVAILVSDSLDQKASVRVTRQEHGARISASEQAGARIEQQAAIALVARVTFVTVLDQQRSYLAFKELDPTGVARQRKRRENDSR